MDGSRFDTLTRTLSVPGTRRRVLELLAAVPVIAGLLGVADADKAEAKDRRRRRKQRHKKRKDKSQGKRQGKRQQRACKPKSRATVCAGKCGEVKNRDTCGKAIDCGSCDCTPPCGECFTCQDAGPNAPGTCIIDSAQQGQECGESGQICQPDGSCACIPLTECPAGKVCGTVPDGCGGEMACPVTCVNPTPVCSNDNICLPCTTHGQCGDAAICVEGLCVACDVCKGGSCAFTSIQAAISATSPQLATIRVCPGTYAEDGPGTFAVDIRRPLTLIGAGDGDDPATSTIITPANPVETVMLIYLAGTVRLEDVRITGGNGLYGRGVNVGDVTLTLARCTITSNSCSTRCRDLETPGGIGIFENGHVTLIDSHVVNNTGGSSGGIRLTGGSLTLDTLSRVTGNHAAGLDPRVGGINGNSFPVYLPSAENVTGNTPNNCQGSGFTGAGAVCTSS